MGVQGEGFKSRKPLPESWRGVRDEKLSELIGIPEVGFSCASNMAKFLRTLDTRQKTHVLLL